jgi:hypothetical protein
VLVGGSAAAIYAGHRISVDGDHVLTDLRSRFDDVLAELESVAGWKTARVQRPVQILGSLDGIDTGVRQLIRDEPLETTRVQIGEQETTVPTRQEILRIKAVLILRRNATRDYLDFAARADSLGDEQVVLTLRDFDRIYPQPDRQSALMQLQIQLANPLPYDLDTVNLAEYKKLDPRWQDWDSVKAACARCTVLIFDRILGAQVAPTERHRGAEAA